MLPKPKHSVTVGNNKNKVFTKETNRVLVPHTLTKKKDVKKSESLPKPTPVNKKVSLVNEESDDEDDADDGDLSGTNFFSFSDTSSKDTITNKEEAPAIKTEVKAKLSDEKAMMKPSIEQAHATVVAKEKKDNTHKSEGKDTKSNAYFANLFKNKTAPGKEAKPTPQTNPEKTDEQSSKPLPDVFNQATVTKQAKSTLQAAPSVQKPALQTSYGVTAPYGAQATLDHYEEPVTAPLTTGGVTAPYGSYGGYQQYNNQGTNVTTNSSNTQGFFSYSHETKAPGVGLRLIFLFLSKSYLGRKIKKGSADFSNCLITIYKFLMDVETFFRFSSSFTFVVT